MENKQEITQKIKINIRSLITNLDDTLDQKGCAINVNLEQEDLANDGYDECIEFSTEGTLKTKGDTVEITYQENEALGMGDGVSTLRFKKSRPSLSNLIRSGSAPASLVFDSYFPRHNCTYCLGNMPFSFAIITNEIANNFDEFGGSITLDYQIEIHGVITEHNVFTLDYKI